jgi:hypothetical protein
MDNINESQSSELLMNMYNFYKKRYSADQKSMEDKFNTAALNLIDSNDITKKEYIEFCVTHDIEPVVKKTPTKTSTSSSYTSDPCGHSYSRSSC